MDMTNFLVQLTPSQKLSRKELPNKRSLPHRMGSKKVLITYGISMIMTRIVSCAADIARGREVFVLYSFVDFVWDFVLQLFVWKFSIFCWVLVLGKPLLCCLMLFISPLILRICLCIVIADIITHFVVSKRNMKVILQESCVHLTTFLGRKIFSSYLSLR